MKPLIDYLSHSRQAWRWFARQFDAECVLIWLLVLCLFGIAAVLWYAASKP